MAIPKYDEIQLPALKLLSDGNELKSNDFVAPLAKTFKLTEEEVNQVYESKNGHVFKDRINWALSYLNMAGLIRKPKRGVFQINDEGLKLLSNPEKFREYIDKKIDNREPVKRKKSELKTVEVINEKSDFTPAESLFTSFQGIKKSPSSSKSVQLQ